ncbi:SAM-dependent methyltransferase, partial [Bordetella pertussis]|uniref:SAM-dependent methyltransferase n=1 Tax=Bordetella pertussis TaxID=520 RepID=UPI003879CCAA
MQAALGLGGAGGRPGGWRCRSWPAQGDAWSRVADRVAAQHWPAATLYVIATPIGNLGDLGLRAWQALVRADVIAAEDTRASRTLLDAWGVST